MELLLLVFFCLLTGSEVTFGAGTTITVDDGSNVILPCSLREDITNKKFVWKKDGRQVFLYDDGDHSNIVNTGQDQQFIGRVEHFLDKLKSGNASITISNTKVTDSGYYTCEFPDLQPRQIFYIQLLVVVTSPQPSVRILEQTDESALLQCEVRGGFPKPELHWEDGAGNKLPADEPQESERGGLFYIILQLTVTETDNYRCVATQKEINHQTDDETYVYVPGLTAGEIAAIVVVPLLVFALVLALLIRWYHIVSFLMKAEAKPSVTILKQKGKSAVLQCEVRGAFPKPELHWEDSDGNILPAPKPEVTKRGGLYNIILQPTVTTTDYYRCVVTQKKTTYKTDAYIYVYFTERTVIIVEEGRDVILPCLLREDITNKKFEWKKGGRQVFLYDDGDHSNNAGTGQDQQFKGGVEYFRDKLKSGNASIIIRDMKVDDSGDYTCEFPDLQPRQIFHIHLVVEKKVTGEEGRDVTLPCSLNTEEDITNKKFVWKKDGRQVFLYDAGDHSNNANTGQDQRFKGRVSHSPDELKSGDASITISNMKFADTGVYTCEFPDLQPRQIFRMKLIVYAPNPCDDDPAVLPTERTAVFPVDEGSDVTLPCSLSSEDLTNKKFVWKKDGRQVFLYDKGSVNSQPQDKQLKGRVVHLPDKLKSGDASIIIRNTRVTDRGDYTCEFPDLQPRQIFYVKLLDVAPNPRNDEAAGLLTGNTDGRDVEAGLPLMTADTPL